MFRPSVFIALTLSFSFPAPLAQAQPAATFQSGAIKLEFDSEMRTRIAEPFAEDFLHSENLELVKEDGAKNNTSFQFVKMSHTAKGITVTGKSTTLEKQVTLWKEPSFPGAILFKVRYKNISGMPLTISGWENARHRLGSAGTEIWSYQPGAYTERPNWLLPVGKDFQQRNFLGMNDTDYGGGTPLLAIWGKSGGIAVGISEPKPRQISLPVSRAGGAGAFLAVAEKLEKVLAPNAAFETPVTFLTTFEGDAFRPLRAFSEHMKTKGLKMARAPLSEFGPIWCAWGYGREFTLQQIMETIPMAKKLGFEWVGLDDGWQQAIGDWKPNSKKFPGGEADLKKLIKEIHKHGMKVQLWWAPLAAHRDSEIAVKHPERLLLKDDLKPRDISWWDAWYLCPAQKDVKREVEMLTHKFFADWGIDGLKLDGQHLNSAGNCHNKAHRHPRPEESVERFSEIQAAIYRTALKLKSKALVEACPCGSSYSIYNLPYQNMTVAADPLNSEQVRQKGKVLRALTGNGVVYFGDHVELTRGEGDFASTVGIGGLVGSNFSLGHLNPPPPPPEDPTTELGAEREAHWAKWIKIAKAYPLWKGDYQGQLYDIGFDKPEAHAVLWNKHMHYAFYFADEFSGTLELRGLKHRQRYKVMNYVDNVMLGDVTGPVGKLEAKFNKNLLLVALPIQPSSDSK